MAKSGEKKLLIASFAIHATRGVIRNQSTRRKAMFILLVAALALLYSGSTFFSSTLNPREHPAWFIFFWLICIWLTFTALLLAIFDMLFIRARKRKVEEILCAGLAESPDSPAAPDDE